jgi:hypothetical protein
LYCPQEIFAIDRFFQVVNGSHLHRSHVRGRVAISGQHQDRHVPVSCHGKLQDELLPRPDKEFLVDGADDLIDEITEAEWG